MRRNRKTIFILSLLFASLSLLVLVLQLTSCSNTTNIIDGVSYTIEDNTCVVSDYDNEKSEVTILDNVMGKPVTKIGEYAFKGAQKLRRIELPDTIDSIEEGAFLGCLYLNSIVIPESIKEISSYAFFNCEMLAYVSLPTTLERIERYAFYNCCSLEEIDLLNVKYYGEFAFAYCSELKNITIPEETTLIPESMFEGCTNLEDVILPSSINTISQEAFASCSSLKTINLPNIDTLNRYTFYNCLSLYEITIPETVDVINCGCFSGCNFLTSVTFLGEDNIWYLNYKGRTKIDVSNEEKVLRYITSDLYSWHKSV